MKAILMAAGMGTRISSETNKPKSLLPLKNESLIMHTVKLLQKNNIDVYIILGYKGYTLREELKDMNITFFENPFYEVTNSIASLWFARDLLDGEDILLANADVFYTQEILDELVKQQDEVTMLADSSRIKEGDYFFKCEGNRLIDYGKELKEKDRSCEYVGIAKISKTFLPTFKKQLEELVTTGQYNFWWENTLYSMKDEVDIIVKDINGYFWGEVDTKEDYRRILDYINS
ncbi:choline kinase [Breznakia sp. PF5-3]|uniref:phosphocholine cytidylyltransferase family protein n=1 Tax=unclassified Breznakia TaxID=2623764 RepID=UPI00240696C5|nr:MULTISPECIES: phosphocholine cytidylyltransferase family protein [unclassified Breznakia]MDF9824697.1 choline kinase [Breznakia sp. PM6-1]MDF9835360.1 choline kinase [Breznakia sp. PF5-3]MDF9836959.1 choline kinase [Breznakia sp. PFB2-8]MDF9859595.1 choline kinase [Breznakia sp. PH5-24]